MVQTIKSRLALSKFPEMGSGIIVSMCKNKNSDVVFMLERHGIEGTIENGAVIHTFELKDGANLSEAKNFRSTKVLKNIIKNPQAIAVSHDGESLYIYDDSEAATAYFIKVDMTTAYDITSIDIPTIADNIVMTRDGLQIDGSAKPNQQAFTQANADPSWAAFNADSTKLFFYDQINNEIQTVPLHNAKAIHETGSGSLVTTADELVGSISTNPTDATNAASLGVTNLATTSSGTGTGAILSVTVASNTVTEVTVTTAGSGYKVGDTLTVAAANIPGGTAGGSNANLVFTLAAGDIAALDAAVDLPTEITGGGNGLSVAFNSDNTAIFMIDYNYNLVKVSLLDGAFDFTTLGYTSSSDSFQFGPNDARYANTFFMSDNGKKIYVNQMPGSNLIDPNIYEFEMTTAFDVTTLKQVTKEDNNYNPSSLVTNTFKEVRITLDGDNVSIYIPDTQVFKEGAFDKENKKDLLEILGNKQLMRTAYTQQKMQDDQIIDQPSDEIFKENLETVLRLLGFTKDQIDNFIDNAKTKRVLVDEEQGLVSDVFMM